MTARIGVNEEGFSICTKKLLLVMPVRLNSHAVTVVPILAPMMTLIACFKVINPEFTKPTTMTVVADELWMTAVIPNPVRRPTIRLDVSLLRSERRLLPALLSKACPMIFIPNKKRDKPPSIVKKSNISIIYHSFIHVLSDLFKIVISIM